VAYEKRFDDLTHEDRKNFRRIDLYDDNETRSVEDRKWMPYVGNGPTPETKILYVPVPSCDDAMPLAKAKLGIS
jgi:hypothetical protein